ncbi:hypothetical protein M378DRAFT_86367 [Amanita muscaria Koide BX008]|uniref:Uncharacterized protein n=1 Tax=Amanita muscaria (strain Koide BX008) TaxID=946122 RepID=A0A0C2WQM2_AMAMK|nr:hypothetical protein M378DRAFT_86367 [Amanita muscaria Koide BX008]
MAGQRLRQEPTLFERIQNDQHEAGWSKWGPFVKESDWTLARWVVYSGTTQKDADKLLELEVVSYYTKPSFHNMRSLLKNIDRLPQGPEWSCEMFEVVGNELGDNGQPKIEKLELWKRDPVKCVKELIGNPMFKSYMTYAPYRAYENEDGSNRCWDEMATANWWWDMQNSEDLPDNATIAPVMLATDKTQLTTFSGDKQAWPIYLTIGNIDKAIPGINGVEMSCADGWVRHVFPILAAYIADFPEQCLVACCRESRCPQCLVESNQRGSPTWSVLRDHRDTVKILHEQAKGLNPRKFEDQGLRPVRPFWDNLPHANIFLCFTPDILHQLHKGVFKDHLVTWSTRAARATTSAGEIDRRFKAMPRHPTLRHFKKGISAVSQWTGNEYKNMEKVFVGILTGAADEKVVRVARAVVDFIMFARFEMHTEETLERMDKAWSVFHEYKDIFRKLEIRTDFNIPKIHSMIHYVSAIRTHGTLDGYNTEAPERLHIDFAKLAYRSSNKRNYSEQMAKWMARQDAIRRYDMYLRWLNGLNIGERVGEANGGSGESETMDVRNTDMKGSDDKGREERGHGDNAKDMMVVDEGPSSYTLAKNPGYGHMTVDDIVNKFDAPDFERHLQAFLISNSLPIPRFYNTLFPVYKRFTIKLAPLPQVSDLTCLKDTVRTILPEPAQGRREPVPAQFDTVLAVEKRDRIDQNVSHDIKRLLKDISVAQVRTIFQLPLEFRSFKKTLAYVEWFTPLQRIDPVSGMYKIRRSTHMHRPRASIIPLDQILQSCHLIPMFGPQVGRDWTPENALQMADTFYLNTDLRIRDFYLLRYTSCQ